MSKELPPNWDAFKAFMMSDTVTVKHKPLLPLMFEVYEAAWRHEFPAAWMPYIELHALRNTERYAEIIAAEERCGRYYRGPAGNAEAPAAKKAKKK